MTLVAQGLVVLAGVWLIALGVLMAVAPQRSLSALAAMGGSARIHFGEMAIRAFAGLVLIGAAPASRLPLVLTVFGGFLIVSAVVIAVLPRHWHSTYSRWGAARIPAWAVRGIGPLSAAGGAALIWVVV
ncbi:hypothetical protein [Brevundimonas sp.]